MDLATVPPSNIRILVVHDSYQQRGGEDNVVDSEVTLLRTYGHQVEVYRRHNDEVGGMSKVALALQTVWSPRTVADVSGIISQFRPDVIHSHNTFPLVSPSLYWAASKAHVPVVQTLHNFRLVCLQAMLLRDGHICEDCLGRFPWRGVVRRCYRRSAPQSATVAVMVGVHRVLGTYRHKVARYIALTDFSRRKFVEGGLPADRIAVKPHFVDVPPRAELQRVGGLFVGRLSHEKGIDVLLGAITHSPGLTIRVVGSGPEARQLAFHPNIILLGWKAWRDMLEEMYHAAYLVLPSLCYENFPLAIVEAYACGLPVIASRSGAMAELIEDGRTGLLCEPGSAYDLAAKMKWADANPERMREMGRIARAVYESKYTPSRNYPQLRDIYSTAITGSV